MKLLKVLAVAAAAVGAWLLLVWLLPSTHQVTFGDAGDETTLRLQLLEDDHDRGVYLQRGSWLPRQQVPYLEVHAEYPEIATWFCALPYLFIDDAPSDPAAYQGRPPAPLVERYLNLFSASMALALFLLIAITAVITIKLGNDPRRAWFLLLPASMYFGLSRYDVLPALLISGALLLLMYRRHLLATFVLSLAVLTKWYPILFLPFFLNYTRNTLKRPILPALALSAATAAAVLGTTFITSGKRYQQITDESPRANLVIGTLEAKELPDSVAGLVEKLPESWQAFATGGLRGVLSPYLHQGARITNAGGIYYQMQTRWFDIEPGSDQEKWILKTLTLGQFFIMLFGFLIPMRSPEQLIRWMCLGTAFFILSAKFYSPQWVIWTTALAAPFMKSRLLILTTIVMELFIYFQMGIIRGTPLRGEIKPDGTFILTEFWYHLYDVRIALSTVLTLLLIVAVIRWRHEARHDEPAVQA